MAQPALAAQHISDGHGDQQKQNLGKGIGVFIKAPDAAGHPLVQVHVHVGGVDLHPLNSLVQPRQGHHQESQGGKSHEPGQMPPGLHRTDNDHHTEHARHVVEQKAGGQGGVGRQGPGHQDHRPKGHNPGPQKGQIQPEVPLPHARGHRQKEAEEKPGEAVRVVPVFERDHHDHQHQPGHRQGGLLHHREHDPGGHTVLKCLPAGAIQLLQQDGGNTEQEGQNPAQAAVLPGLGQTALPGYKLDQDTSGAGPAPGLGNPPEHLGQQTVFIPRPQPEPHREQQASEHAALDHFHRQSLLSFIMVSLIDICAIPCRLFLLLGLGHALNIADCVIQNHRGAEKSLPFLRWV